MLVFGDLLLEDIGVLKLEELKFKEAELSTLECWNAWNLATRGKLDSSLELDMSESGRETGELGRAPKEVLFCLN